MMTETDPADFPGVAVRLGDTPHTTVALHALATRRGRAWVGDDAIIVRADYIAHEPYVYGQNAEALSAMLRDLSAWTAVTVDEAIADQLQVSLRAVLNGDVRQSDDIYFEQQGLTAIIPHPMVRQLTIDDFDLLVESPRQVQGENREYALRLLEEGLIVAAIAAGHIVNTMHCYCTSPCYGEIGANTLPDFRRRGFALASGSLLCSLLHARGLVPTWSTGAQNSASQSLAAALGFIPYARRVYLIPADSR